MRIAVLSTLASGGAASAAWRLTRALADFGHECSFFVLEASGNPRHIPLLDGDAAFWVPALFNRWFSLTTPEALAANGVELLSDQTLALHTWNPLPQAIREAEVIHLHWVAGMLFSPALLTAIAGKKVIWTLHDENAFTGGCHYAGTCRSFTSQCRDCPLLKKPGPDDVSARSFRLKKQLYPLLNPFLITPSAWLAEEVKASVLLGSYPVAALPNPLDMEILRPPQDKPALRRKLGLPEDAFVILAGCENLGNPRKNTRVLFEALAQLSEESPGVPIAVLLYGHGQPPELAFPVHHFGYVDNETTMAELYGAADLFIHTSRQDNLPLTLCEAQACGAPTLSFAVGGCPETMLPGKTGFLVTETNSKALAEKLRAIIADRDSLIDMRTAARAFAEKRFNPHTIAAAYTEVFAEAQAAPGLQSSDPLFAELVQNQIASLASFFKDADTEQTARQARLDGRVGGIEACLPQLDARVGGLEAYLPHLDSRVREVEASLPQFVKQHEALQQQGDDLQRQHETLRQQNEALHRSHEALQQGLDSLRRNLRHPFHWFFRKLRARFYGKEGKDI